MSAGHERPRLRRPLLVVSFAIPTEVAGTNIVVRRLLENFDPRDVVLLARAADPRASLGDIRLPYRTVTAIAPARGGRGERFKRLLAAAPMVVQGMAIARRVRPGAILGIFPEDGSLLTAWLLHRATGLPLLPYLGDLYMEDRVGDGWEARLSRWLQPRVFRDARRVVVVNRGMADFYRERYGIDALCVPTCINQPIPPPAPVPPPHRPFRIGYSGNVNATRAGSMQALAQALGNDPAYEIRYFTPQTMKDLEFWGVATPNSRLDFVKDEATLVTRLQECDALFLPLTFTTEGSTRDQLATCFGIKSYEYFLAQRPVVVHTPGDYFLARFYREHGCGIVVDQPEPAALGAAFARLRDTPQAGADLARKGLEAARQFEGPAVAAILKAELDAIIGGAEGGP